MWPRIFLTPRFIFSDDAISEYVILAYSFQSSAQIPERTGYCSSFRLRVTSLAFSFLLPRSSNKISWQAFLLMLSSSDNIRTVMWRFLFFNNAGLTQCCQDCGWWMDGRTSYHLPFYSLLHENTYTIKKTRFITVHMLYFSGTSLKLHTKHFALHWRGWTVSGSVLHNIIESRCNE